MNSRDRQFWTEFLLLYRSLPAVWKVKSPEYSSRSLKTAGYEKLVRKLREVEPKADRSMVVKKINSFRTNFRRDLRKRDHCTDDEPFVSTLWYFDLLDFLEGQDEGNSLYMVKSSPTHRVGQQSDGSMDAETMVFISRYEEPRTKKSKRSMADMEIESLHPNTRHTTERSVSPTKSQSSFSPTQVEHDLHHREHIKYRKLCKRRSTLSESDSLAHTWGSQYNELSLRQKVLARKLISDILYYGCMQQLEPIHVTQLQDIVVRRSPSPLVEDLNASKGTSKANYEDDFDEIIDACQD